MNPKDNSTPQTNPIQDDGIIELTDVVYSPQDDEEIIDLVEEVDSAAQEPEEIIELTDAVSSPESGEEIVDWVEEVPGPPAEDEAAYDTEEPAVEKEAFETPEKIPESAQEVMEEEAISSFEEPAPAQENIIELSGAPSGVSHEDAAGEYGLDNALEEEELPAKPEDEDFVDAIGLDLDENAAGGAGAQAPRAPVEVTSDQVEAAVERVLERLFSEKIEAMIVEAIEKAVSKEIEALKAALLEDHG